MGERQTARDVIHAKRQAYLDKVQEKDIHKLKPDEMRQDIWDRKVKIGLLTNYGRLNQPTIAKKIGVAPLTVGLDNRDFLITIWGNSPDDIKEGLTLQELLTPHYGSRLRKEY